MIREQTIFTGLLFFIAVIKGQRSARDRSGFNSFAAAD
jgi:hypothetical protein